MVQAGHDVTVATSSLAGRESNTYCKVTIQSFAVAGNLVNGMTGEVDAYRRFLIESDFDVLFVYAAQQWTFDALWEVLADLPMRKVVVPCGYSGLLNPAYQRYFEKLPAILEQFDAIVYHAKNYRDYEFGQRNGLEDRAVVIPNGADDQEFSVEPDLNFRHRMGIPENALMLLTVGSLNGAKGHLEITQAFEQLDLQGRSAVLLLNGNQMPRQPGGSTVGERISKIVSYIRTNSPIRIAKTAARVLLSVMGFRFGYFAYLERCVGRINGRQDRKVILCDLERRDLVQAYLAADMFVFASNIEYSPLVLYEACAAGLPFLSVSAGNAAEIAAWTGGGETIAVAPDNDGMVKVSPTEFAAAIGRLLADQSRRLALGESGRKAWQTRFNWEVLSREYLQLFERVCVEREK
jgi:glycosyltransferase involved in cell wall biosynthesis